MAGGETSKSPQGYTVKEMMELHRRYQDGRGSVLFVDDASSLQGANQTENNLNSELNKESTDDKSRADAILKVTADLLSRRDRTLESFTDEELRLFFKATTDLYDQKFPFNDSPDKQGFKLIEDYDSGIGDTESKKQVLDFLIAVGTAIENIIDRHDIAREEAKILQYIRLTDSIVTQDELKSMDGSDNGQRTIDLMNAAIKNGKLDAYLQAINEATAKYKILFDSKSIKENVQEIIRLRLEAAFLSVATLWNYATSSTISRLQEASTYNKPLAVVDEKYRLKKFITAGEKLDTAYKTSRTVVRIRHLNKKTLESAKALVQKLS